MRAIRSCTNVTCDIVPAHARHPDIEESDLRPMFLGQPNRRLSAVGDNDFVTFKSK
jgi:hypothetical protein